MRVVSVRRYPVKSMGGESLTRVGVDARGLEGDRWYAVTDEDGRLASGKNSQRFRHREEVFGYTAATRIAGDVMVTGPGGSWGVGDRSLDDELTRATGARVRVMPETGVPHQDMGGVSLVGTATLDWCAQRWGIDADPRRLRVNIVFSSSEPFVEEGWVGRLVTIGTTRLRVVEPIPRCRMIDIDQDGATAEGRWLQLLGRERGARLAVVADVEVAGWVGVGDPITFPRTSTCGSGGTGG